MGVIELQAASQIICGLFVGTMTDGADALCRGNPLGVHAVVNCAQEDWLHQMKRGRCGSEVAAFSTPLRQAFDKLEEVPEGGAMHGKVMGVAYLGFSAKDVDTPSPTTTKSKAYVVADHFPAAMAFMSRHLGRGEKVLLHCLRGENRSAAVCAAFLIRERGMPCDEAINLLREKRGENALSNQSFVDELRRLLPQLSSSPLTCPDLPQLQPLTTPEHIEWPPTPVKPAAASEKVALHDEDAGVGDGTVKMRRSTACDVL